MKLFQYWDTGEPPDDVAGCIEGFRVRNRDMQHRLYDRDRAAWFCGKHFGERERRAFDALAVPAMQADYFRLCALVAKGGVWFDVDCVAARPLATLVDMVPSLLLVVIDRSIINSTLIARAPGNPFLAACLELSTQLIEERQFADALRLVAIPGVAGPGLMTAAWALAPPEPAMEGPLWPAPPHPAVWRAIQGKIAVTPAIRRALAEATLLKLGAVQRWGRPVEPSYKDSPQHWLHWDRPIYVDSPPIAVTV